MNRKSQNSFMLNDSNGNLIIDRKVIFLSLIFVGIYWIITLYKPVISSLVIGILLAYLLHPIAVILSKKLHFNSRLSGGIVFVSFLILIFFAVKSSTPILIRQINILATDFEIFSEELIGLQPALDNLVDINIPLADIIPEIKNEINLLLVPSKLFRITLSATSNLVWVMVILMTCIYLLMDHSKLINWVYFGIPYSMRGTFGKILSDINLEILTFKLKQFGFY